MVLLVSCADVPNAPRSAMTGYIGTTRDRLMACIAAVSDGMDRARSCDRGAREVQQQFGEALELARHERGTTYYLKFHQQQWIDTMSRLAATQGGIDAARLAVDVSTLERLERRLH